MESTINAEPASVVSRQGMNVCCLIRILDGRAFLFRWWSYGKANLFVSFFYAITNHQLYWCFGRSPAVIVPSRFLISSRICGKLTTLDAPLVLSIKVNDDAYAELFLAIQLALVSSLKKGLVWRVITNINIRTNFTGPNKNVFKIRDGSERRRRRMRARRESH